MRLSVTKNPLDALDGQPRDKSLFRIASLAVLVLAVGACSSASEPRVSASGTRLLAAASLKSGASDGVSYSAESSTGDGSTARETFMRRGEASVVMAE